MSNRPCPECRKQNRDSTGNHLYLMKDGVTWTCQKSEVHPPYYERDGEQIISGMIRYEDKFTIKDIITLPLKGNEDRKISQSTHEHFKVRTECSEADGTPVAYYYPETTGGKLLSFKKRQLPKKFSVVANGTVTGTPDFFGQFCCPKTGKRLLITAGEEDCMAAYEMLLERYPEYTPAVVSVPRGETGSLNTFSENMSFFDGFEEVVLCMDMDQAGEKAINLYAPVIGDKVRVMTLSEKDPSDMKVKNKQNEFINAYFKCREWRPSNIVKVGDILEDAVQPVPWGLSYPFPTLTKYTYGLKKGGEIISIGAGQGKQLPL